MNKNENIQYLEEYLERKVEEIVKVKNKLESFKEENQECVEAMDSIERKITELQNKDFVSENDKKHIESLKNTLEIYRDDIMRLSIEILSTNEMLEDLEENIISQNILLCFLSNNIQYLYHNMIILKYINKKGCF